MPRHRPAPPYVPAPARLRRARSSAAVLATHLSDRDRWLLAMLAEHHVLTSHHLHRLAFTTLRAANRRLLTLHRYGLLDSFRPHLPTGHGSAPEHYLLARAGAQLIAAAHEVTLKDLGWRPELLAAIAHSPTLRHTIGIADLITRLADHARTHPEQGQLTAWWSERSCARTWGRIVRPDAYARWTTPSGARTDFFLEYDTGTEPLPRLLAKMPAYQRLASSTGITTPLLIHLPNPAREQHLHALLGADLARLAPNVPVATSHPNAGPPALAAWLPATPHTTGRLRLAELADPAAVSSTAAAAQPPPRASRGWSPPPPFRPASSPSSG